MALDCGPEQRSAFLSDACGADEGLRREVEALILAHEKDASFLAASADEVAARLPGDEKPELSVGQMISAYEILSFISRGGMGVVFLAQDRKLNRKVALKLLPHELTDNRDRLQRFEHEARATSALNHPNILTIYEIGASDGVTFIATEFIEGETLSAKMKGEHLSYSEILDLAIQITSALAAAHQAGIVHRDIKPENIMVRRDGIAKLLDFGLAKTVGTSAALDYESPTRPLARTDPGVVMGTVSYMSPEQARGKPVDGRTDIWSLGVALYEIVSGTKPFSGETAGDVIAAILKTNPAPLKDLAPEVPDELQRIVLKMLRHDKEARYQTATELLVDLKSLKQELEFAAKLERSVAPPSQSQNDLVVTAQANVETQSGEAKSTAAYLVAGVKRYRLAVLAALLLLAVVIAGLAYYFRDRSTPGAIESIAVLPFDNQNHDADSDYLADGVTESIINSLTGLPNLKVIARSSVFRYKGKQIDPFAAGKELGVRAILTGRIVQRGDQLTISAELIDVRDNKQLWGEKYDRKVADLLAIQREIAQEITSNLRLKLSGESQNQVTKRYTESPEAYQLYLKGRFYWNKRTEESFDKAIDYFRQAIARDPNYALAYTGLADSYSFLSSQAIRSPRDVFPLAKEAATKAIQIDGSLSEAHTSLAYVKLYYDWDWAGAEQEYLRAIELNPNYSTPHHGYAYLLLSSGRTDAALAEIAKAEQIDPLSLVLNTDHGEYYYFARRPAEAIAQLKKAIDLDPSFVRAHLLMSRALVQQGRCSDAIPEVQKTRNLVPSIEVLGWMAQVYASCGQRAEAQKALAELLDQSKEHYVSPHWIAAVQAGLGNRDEAFKWLDQAVDQRFGPLIYLKVNPIWDPLRADPRFAIELRRVGLAQ